jgi:hypothetical protein
MTENLHPSLLHLPIRGKHRLTGESFQGMMHPRFVVLKSEGADPPDDEEYESNNDCFTNACATAPSGDWRIGRLAAVRYDVDDL